MNDKHLSAQFRTEDFGSSGSRRVLRSGRIPAVIYGKNAPVHVTLNAKEFTNKLRHFSETTLLTIATDSKEFEVLMKDYQEDLMHGAIKHVDFFEVTRGHALRTHISIVLHGNAKGVREGGVVDQVMHEVEIECLPKDLPESIVVDISDLGVNESLHVNALNVPAGVKLHVNPDATVVSVKSIKEEVVEPAADAAAPAEVTTAAAPAASEATPAK